jgi:hypothetical protein
MVSDLQLTSLHYLPGAIHQNCKKGNGSAIQCEVFVRNSNYKSFRDINTNCIQTVMCAWISVFISYTSISIK